MIQIRSRHHINIHTGTKGIFCGFLPILTVAVGDGFFNGSKIRDQNAIKSKLSTENISHQMTVCGCRDSVNGVKGRHDHTSSGIDACLIPFQIKFLKGMAVHAYRVIIPACLCSAITCKVLDAGTDFSRRFHIRTLEAFHLGFHKTGTEIRILSERFHHSSPSGIPHQVCHGRKSHMETCSRRFFCRNLRTLFCKLRLKGSRLSQRSRKNGLHSMDHIHHKKKRDLVRLMLHIFFLDLFTKFRSLKSQNRTCQSPVFIGKIQAAVRPCNKFFSFFHIIITNDLKKLSYLLLQGHLFQQGFQLLFFHGFSSLYQLHSSFSFIVKRILITCNLFCILPESASTPLSFLSFFCYFFPVYDTLVSESRSKFLKTLRRSVYV